MIIGVPKEVKDHETRVGLVPSGVTALREAGHEVLVETHAGRRQFASPTANTCRPARTFVEQRAPRSGARPTWWSR